MPPRIAWQDIQENTFTRWTNDELKLRGLHINSLKDDLKDGLMLINLMEIISGKSLGKYNKHPIIIQQKLENLTIALKFIQSEGLKLVNIGPEDIVQGNMRCILGLIWTIILRYEINRNGGGEDLLKWIQSKIPEYGIKNFTKDWNDGRALNALINALRPDLCKDHMDLDKKKKLANARRGIETADKEMGVDKLVLPEEMIHKRVDKQAMMTYLAQFRNLKDTNAAYRVRAFGEGLHKGIKETKAPFFVERPTDAKGEIKIKVLNEDGKEVSCDITKAESPAGYEKLAVSYVPQKAGVYKVHVTLDDKHVPGSVFTVVVEEDLSIGGEGKVFCFFSTTSGNLKQRSDINNTKTLLTSKNIHLRKDFVPWIPVDIMDRKDREAVFAKAGTRKLPIVIIDDEYLGDYDKLLKLEEEGKLDGILKMDQQELITLEEHKARLKLYSGSGDLM
mmetsp:Transcript_14405/g.20205  ORF Transcript_14405/g.20205 Transcript_14405/m.20205 type:complete len:448 (+) Transcript_14405:55-1398(+)